MVEEFVSILQVSVVRANLSCIEERWQPPRYENVAINLDVSTGENHCAFAMVVRDSGGRLIYFGSQWNLALEAPQAELEALILYGRPKLLWTLSGAGGMTLGC